MTNELSVESIRELRPCPFCGPKMAEVCVEEGFPSCGNCGVTQPDIAQWNGAKCWEKIDALKAKLEEKDKQLNQLYVYPDTVLVSKGLFDAIAERIDELKTQLTEAQARYQAARNLFIKNCQKSFYAESWKTKEQIADTEIEIEYQRLKGEG